MSPSRLLPRRAGPLRLATASLAAAVTVLLAACGGGGGDAGNGGGGNTPPYASCDLPSKKAALRSYFGDWYFWYKLSPSPDPSGYASTDSYFKALLYTGGDAAFPSDRWSYFDTTASFNRFFGDGRTLGYGVFVAGLEVQGHPERPLYVRYVEPRSPAAIAGLQRGDRLLTINGRSAADVIAADDFAALTPANAGDTLTLDVATVGGTTRTLALQAAVYDLVPVTQAAVVTSPAGRKAGYLMVKDMLSQAVTPFTNAMADFRAAGVSELVLDLRYNGGGLVSVGRDLASLIAGERGAGSVYASLLYNDRRAASNNQRYLLNNPPGALGLSRVYILAGERTCSASEQLANGLRPFVDVVLVGDTTCGKPVGFLPWDDGCGTTYSVVNFESVNARNEGRYFSGLTPSCAVAEDWTRPLGSTAEPLLATALAHADGQACVVPSAASRAHAQALRAARPWRSDGERPAMIPR